MQLIKKRTVLTAKRGLRLPVLQVQLEVRRLRPGPAVMSMTPAISVHWQHDRIIQHGAVLCVDMRYVYEQYNITTQRRTKRRTQRVART